MARLLAGMWRTAPGGIAAGAVEELAAVAELAAVPASGGRGLVARVIELVRRERAARSWEAGFCTFMDSEKNKKTVSALPRSGAM